jgi:hypothetical protein
VTRTEERVPTIERPVVAPASVPPSVESELFEIDGQKGLSRHLLVFTNQRIIISLVGGGKTRLLTAGALRMIHEGRKIKKMKERDIADLLSDDKTYTIPYAEINSIMVERGGRMRGGKITINKAFGGDEKFTVDIRKKIDGFERVMRPIFNERLTVRR